MNFPDVVFYGYLLLGALGLLWLWHWLLGYMSALDIAPEKRGLFTILIVTLVAFAVITYAFKLNSWRHNQQAGQTNSPGEATLEKTLENNATPGELAEPAEAKQTEEQKLSSFEQTNYPGLYEQRTALYREIKGLERFFTQVESLVQPNPKQIPLLKDIYRIRKDSHAKFSRRYLEVSQHLRNFWVHYNTGNPTDAVNKFNVIADKLISGIQETRGDDLDNQREEEKRITEHLRRAEALLKNNKLPDQKAGITSYKPENRNSLLLWLQQYGTTELLETLKQMGEQRQLISQRSQQLSNYMQRYPDLRSSLEQTQTLWQQAMQHNLYAEYRLLFAMETQYILETLGITSAANTRKRLDATLETYLPSVVNHVNDTLARAEGGYNPKLGK